MMMMDKEIIIKRMPIKEFRKEGFLQVLNRQFLHLLGLALEVIVDAGEEKLGGVWDYRDDSVGLSYSPDMLLALDYIKKVKQIKNLGYSKAPVRREKFGWIIQPVGEKIE